jgi:uncharacterized protein YkwD
MKELLTLLLAPVLFSSWVNIQVWRVRNGLSPYIKDDRLCEFADSRIYQLSTDWSHDGFYADTEYVKDFAEYGENLARNDATKDVLNAWLNSAPHKELLRSDFKYGCLVCRNKFCVLEVAK